MRSIAIRDTPTYGTIQMTLAKFGAGQGVTLARPPPFHAPGAYIIVSLEPCTGGAARYRVRSEAEAFDRIVDESALESSIFA
jgi:hypothetical protein